MEVSEDGQIVTTAYKISDTSAKPVSTRVLGDYGGAGVERTFKSMSGESKLTQRYNTENIFGRDLRVQTLEEVTSGNMKATAELKNNVLTLEVRPSGPYDTTYKTDIDLSGISGKVVNFSIKTDQNRLVVHVADGPDIIEYTFSLHHPSDGQRGKLIAARVRGEGKLTAAQIKSLGLIAEMKTIPGRKAASAPVRDMEVVNEPAGALP